MNFFGKRALQLGFCSFALFFVACGGSSSNSREGQAAPIVNSGQAALRVMSGSDQNGAIQVLINGRPLDTLTPGEAVGYEDYAPGEYNITVVDAEATRAEGDVLAETNVTLEEDTAYTFAVTGVRLGIPGFLYTDSTTRTGEGAFKLRVVSTSTLLEPVDVYLIGVDQLEIANEVPFFEDLTFGEDSEYIVTAVGDYQLLLAERNTKNIVTRIPIIDPPSESIITMVAIERQGVGGPFQIFELVRD